MASVSGAITGVSTLYFLISFKVIIRSEGTGLLTSGFGMGRRLELHNTPAEGQHLRQYILPSQLLVVIVLGTI